MAKTLLNYLIGDNSMLKNILSRVIHLIPCYFKLEKTSRKGDSPGDEDLYEMVLRSQVSHVSSLYFP